MPRLNSSGVSLYYEVHGQGPTILLTHGYSATSRMWAGQIRALTRNHTLVLWDMRGHGQSDYPDDPDAYSEAATVGDMAAVLDHVGAQDAIIGGLSLGGYMSLAFHLAHPRRTRALLVFDTGPGYKNEEAREGWNRNALATAERYEREGLGVLAQGSVEMRTSRHRDAAGLAHAARGMLVQKDARVISSLPAIRVPTLVVVGGEDRPFLAAADYMADRIAGAKKVVIPGAGHAANIDKPVAFDSAVLGFLEAHRL
jgi:pimeloyl-ACP methyl ester carboxylesterase